MSNKKRNVYIKNFAQNLAPNNINTLFHKPLHFQFFSHLCSIFPYDKKRKLSSGHVSSIRSKFLICKYESNDHVLERNLPGCLAAGPETRSENQETLLKHVYTQSSKLDERWSPERGGKWDGGLSRFNCL